MQDENAVNPETIQEVKNVMVADPEVPTPVKGKKAFFHFDFNSLLGLILLIGLIVLYVLFFLNRKHTDSGLPLNLQKSSGKSLSVVFVNIDSLNVNYEYVKVLRKDLESTGKKLQAEVLSEQSSLEKEAADFQKQIAANAITEEKAKIVYEELMQKQQGLMQKKDRYTQMVAEQEMTMNLKLVDSVTTFLKRFNRTYKFDCILGFKTGGEILVSNDTLDITRQVLDALNQEYATRKK
ncbi:MAG: OmpH family outer membrane protein [Bacteroidales bacterium]|jgi:outer membrane protein|nr:OmpH family outer membrane protein [Bacteroidales bacterium]